jgi:hypothetical protein
VLNKILWLFIFIIVVAAIFKIFNAGSDMYKWKLLADVKYDIETMEFVSATRGWRVEGLPWDFKENDKLAVYRYRLSETSDGGKTWNILYQTNDYIYKIRYMHEMKCLYGLMLEDNPELKRKLCKSTDGGRTWMTVCYLQSSVQGVYFFNDKNGYAWGSNSIYGTYDSAQTWHFISKTKFSILEDHEQMQIIGKDRFIYYVEDSKVYGFNFWDGQRIELPLPAGFEPEAVIARSTGTTIYVLGKILSKWTFLTFENTHLILNESVPIEEKNFDTSSFAYGDNVINVVGTTRGDFFLTYYFYHRDSKGWHKESISGSNNYSKFAYWGDYMWAHRVSLRRGTRELLFREVIE